MAPFKFLASQAHSINQYKNIRTNVLKCCANVYFNRQCLAKKIVPKYTKVKIQYTSPATLVTQSKIHTIRLRGEIKLFHKKTEKLNKDSYNIRSNSLEDNYKMLSIVDYYMSCF